MKWQLAGDWPVKSVAIPAGTVLTGVAGPDGPLAEPPTWHGQPLPMPMPMNATALDEEAALQMCMWYEEAATIGGWHQLHFAHGIDREAVMAQARHNKRWPNGVPSQTMAERPPPREVNSKPGKHQKSKKERKEAGAEKSQVARR